jgi:hypothetical protein
MKVLWKLSWLAVVVAAGALACSAPAPVIQGTVVSLDASSGRLVIQDEERKSDPPLVLDLAGADVGAPPAAGDRVRAVYRASGSINRAIAVMNLSRARDASSSRGHE